MGLFAQNQPYSECLRFTCDVVLEIMESRLDEGLSSLEEDKARLARKEIAIRKEHGSVQQFTKATMEEMQKTESAILP